MNFRSECYCYVLRFKYLGHCGKKEGMKVIEDLKKHAGDLDHNVYKVMVVWDPNLSRDVGWLTVLKEAKVHLPHLQVRDVNMSAFATDMQLLDEMSLSDDLDKSLNLSQEAKYEAL